MKRWTLGNDGIPFEHPRGSWVSFAEAEALQKRLDASYAEAGALEREVLRLRAKIEADEDVVRAIVSSTSSDAVKLSSTPRMEVRAVAVDRQLVLVGVEPCGTVWIRDQSSLEWVRVAPPWEQGGGSW